MQSVFNAALLARLRRQAGESSLTPDRTCNRPGERLWMTLISMM